MSIEAAAALARTPLFAQLERQHLARLAAELEETAVSPGELLVREGDEGDALYIIRTGVAEVKQSRVASELTLLGPGDVIGEMAVIARRPRAASVVARTPLQAWRLSADRFLHLIERERVIAERIEATLTERLAKTSRDIAALQLHGEAMVELVLKVLEPEQLRLLAIMAAVPRWDGAVLDEVSRRTGPNPVLTTLQKQPQVLGQDGDCYVVPPLVASATRTIELSKSEGEWGKAAAGVLADRGEWADAVDLYLRVAGTEKARALLEGRQAQLGDIDGERRLRWLASLGERYPGLFDQMVMPSDVSTGAAQARGPRWAGVVKPAAAWALSVAVFAGGWAIPVPDGLTREAIVTMSTVAAMVPLMSFGVLPEVAVGMLFAAALVSFGVLAPPQVLAGFGSPSWLFLVVLFAIGATVTRTGLMYRLALLSLSRLPPNFIIQSLVLALAGIGLAACVPSARARVALAAPAACGLAEGLRYREGSNGAAATGLVTFISAGPTTLFLTGTSMAVVLSSMLPAAVRADFSWTDWVVGALAPSALLLIFSYLAIVYLLRPELRPALDPERLRVQQQLMGRMTRQELVTTMGVGLLVLGLATTAIHGIDATWISVIVCCLLVVAGVLDWDAVQNGSVWGQLIFFGVLLSLEGIFTALGIDRWLVSVLAPPLGGFVSDPYAFVLMLGLAAFLLRFLVPYQATVTLLALIAIPLALSAGYHPLVPVIVVLIAGNHAFLPHLSTTYLTLHQASGGQLFTHGQAIPVLRFEAVLRIAVVIASVPYWQSLGLL